MKTLHLLRHAKSSWDCPVSDRDRSLNKRGRYDAPRVATVIRRTLEHEVVALGARFWVAASPARRAQETLEELELAWPQLLDFPHRVSEALYTFEVRDLFTWLRAVPEPVDSLLLIGHNPALTNLLNTLVADPAHAIDNLPTAGFVSLSLAINQWADLQSECAKRTQLIVPKQLRAHP